MTQTPDRPAGAVTAEEIRKPLAAYRALAWATKPSTAAFTSRMLCSSCRSAADLT